MRVSPVIVDQCPVGCSFCGYNAACSKEKHLWDHKLTPLVLDDLTRSGMFSNEEIIFWPFGGEIFYEFDTFNKCYTDWMGYLLKNGVPTKGFISTSGTILLDSNFRYITLDWLNNHLECELQFSFDERFDGQEEVFDILKSYNKQIGIKSTFPTSRWKDLYAFCNKLKKYKDQIRSIKITAPSCADLSDGDIDVLKEEFNKFSLKELEIFFSLNQNQLGKQHVSCGIGHTIMIDYNGNYLPCHFGAPIENPRTLGNVYDMGISPCKMRELANLAADSKRLHCPTCNYKSFCYNCPATSFQQTPNSIPIADKNYHNWAFTLGEVYIEKLKKAGLLNQQRNCK